MLDDRTAYDLFARRDRDAAPGVILGVTSTGIYCRAGCPARLPKFENCRFFAEAEAARSAGFRACLRCHPDGDPAVEAIDRLVADIDGAEEPLRERALSRYGLSPSTVRRHFKARFGQTFAQYQRERRLARAQAALGGGDSVIAAQVDAGYASASGFRAAYAKAYGISPSGRTERPLHAAWLDTPLGKMLTLADESALHMAEFVDRKRMDRQMARVRKIADRPIVVGRTDVTDRFERELSDYFSGKLTQFTTPIALNGTAFQSRVWEGLRALPYGTTASYADLAADIGSPKAVRAAAGSNAANALAIIVPCHRIVPKGGGVGGYAGGPERKRWLLAHEAKYKSPQATSGT